MADELAVTVKFSQEETSMTFGLPDGRVSEIRKIPLQAANLLVQSQLVERWTNHSWQRNRKTLILAQGRVKELNGQVRSPEGRDVMRGEEDCRNSEDRVLDQHLLLAPSRCSSDPPALHVPDRADRANMSERAIRSVTDG